MECRFKRYFESTIYFLTFFFLFLSFLRYECFDYNYRVSNKFRILPDGCQGIINGDHRPWQPAIGRNGLLGTLSEDPLTCRRKTQADRLNGARLSVQWPVIFFGTSTITSGLLRNWLLREAACQDANDGTELLEETRLQFAIHLSVSVN